VIAHGAKRDYRNAHDDEPPTASSQVASPYWALAGASLTRRAGGGSAGDPRPTDFPQLNPGTVRRDEMTTASVQTLDHAARNRAIGVALAAIGAGLFSLKGVVIKLAFAEGMGVSQLLTLRMAFSLPFFLGIGIFTFIRSDRR
jgi:hypothetical protein